MSYISKVTLPNNNSYDLKDKLTKLIQETLKNVTYGFVKDINGKERILILELR